MPKYDPTKLNTNVIKATRARVRSFLAVALPEKEEKLPPLPPFKLRKPMRRYSDNFKANVIYRRFGSLTSTATILARKAELVKYFNVPLSTICYWLRKH